MITMRNVGVIAGFIIAALIGAAPCVFAESKPIEQLPGDVVRLATEWTAIPQQMYAVGREEGPLAALTWGPAKGAAVMVQSTTKDVWKAVKPDKTPGHGSRERNVKGLVFRYEF